MTLQRPAKLYLVRHGESQGNLAHKAAYDLRLTVIDTADRDMDVALSKLGEEQATALGRWMTSLSHSDRPEIIISSSYRRAHDTALLMQTASNTSTPLPLLCDERLREKEFGLLNRYTTFGIAEKYPEQAALRAAVGKFYYRPPQGESWADVIQRLRSVLDSISLQYAGKSVIVVTHQVVILCMRYLLEGLNERELLAIDSAGEIANCSVTEYDFAESKNGVEAHLVRFNSTEPLTTFGVEATVEPARVQNG